MVCNLVKDKMVGVFIQVFYYRTLGKSDSSADIAQSLAFHFIS